MDSRSNNRAGIPDLNAALSHQMNLSSSRRDVMQVGTMDDSFYGQMFGGSVVNSHMMGYDHQSISTANYDPDAD